MLGFGLIFKIAAVTSGLLLSTSLLDKWDGEKDFFTKISAKLLPYNTIIGSVIFGLGIFGLFDRGCMVHDIAAICAGLLLISDVLGKAPLIGDLLVKASNALIPFKVIVGMVILVIGVTRFFGIYLLC